MVVHPSLDFRFGRGHASDDPRPKEETDQRPCPTGGSGIGPGHLLALEIDRWNLDSSGQTRVTKYIVPESFFLEQGDFSCAVGGCAFRVKVEVVERATAEMGSGTGNS